MKEIKFRAWNSTTKTMVDLYKITPLAVNVPQDGLFLPFKEEWPLMQYTGLKDKNGKEIYEGDIIYPATDSEPLADYEKPYNFKVVFSKGYFGITQDDFQYEPLFLWAGQSEAIGNIYENPELLEAKP